MIWIFIKVWKTGEIVQLDVSPVSVAVQGSGVTRHQVDGAGDIALTPQPQRSVHHAPLVDQGEVEGGRDVDDGDE